MKGKLYRTPPPGYLTVAQTCKALGMSRANFHDKGYAAALDRWQVSQSTTIYRTEDIANLARWLTVRRGMIALGHWLHNTPGVPTDGGFHTAVHEGYWDVDCSQVRRRRGRAGRPDVVPGMRQIAPRDTRPGRRGETAQGDRAMSSIIWQEWQELVDANIASIQGDVEIIMKAANQPERYPTDTVWVYANGQQLYTLPGTSAVPSQDAVKQTLASRQASEAIEEKYGKNWRNK